MFSIDQVIVWIVVGLIGGALAGALMTWERGGYGLWRNLALGLTGAVIGGLLFRAFGIWPGLDKIAISLRDIVSAVGVAQVRDVTEKRVISVGGPSSLLMTWRRPPTLNAPRLNSYDVVFLGRL